MSHRMKMNEDIITPASPSGDPKLFKSHSPCVFLAPHEAGSIADGNACSRCFACRGLSINRQRIHPITDRHPPPAVGQRAELENATNQPGGVVHLTIFLSVGYSRRILKQSEGCVYLFPRFFEPHHASAVTSSNACSCCCPCDRLFFNGRRIQRETDKSTCL